MDACQYRDRLIDQYKGTLRCQACGQNVDRCQCVTRIAEWVNVALLLVNGPEHLSSVTVPMRIVNAQRLVIAALAEGGDQIAADD